MYSPLPRNSWIIVQANSASAWSRVNSPSGSRWQSLAADSRSLLRTASAARRSAHALHGVLTLGHRFFQGVLLHIIPPTSCWPMIRRGIFTNLELIGNTATPPADNRCTLHLIRRHAAANSGILRGNLAMKTCRRCGESFVAPNPPAKPFGRFIDECQDCSDSLYRPTLESAGSTARENETAERYGGAIARSLRQKGWPASRIAEFLAQLSEPFDL